MIKVIIHEEKCKGCGLCVEFCPKRILSLSEKLNKKGRHPVEIKNEKECLGCGSCTIICPDLAIEVHKD